MPRLRTIKPEFWSSAQVMDCKLVTRLFFIGLWNFADDAGRHKLEPRRLKAQIFPADDEIISKTILGMLDELSTNGLINRYDVAGVSYFEITGWKRHQRIDKPHKSHLPGPDQQATTVDIPGTIAEPSQIVRDGMERKGREEERKKESEAAAPLLDTPRSEPFTGRLPPPLSTEFEELRFQIVAACESANLMPEQMPDTGYVAQWAALGYDPADCLAVFKTRLKPGNPFKSLKYIDEPLRALHENRRMSGQRPAPKPTYDILLKMFKEKGYWPGTLGPEPNNPMCRVPIEDLRRFGFRPTPPNTQTSQEVAVQ